MGGLGGVRQRAVVGVGRPVGLEHDAGRAWCEGAQVPAGQEAGPLEDGEVPSRCQGFTAAR